MVDQLSFAWLDYAAKRKRTKREVFRKRRTAPTLTDQTGILA